MKHIYLILLIFSISAIAFNHANGQDYLVTDNNLSIQEISYYAGTTIIKLNNNDYNLEHFYVSMLVYSSETEGKFQFEQEFVLDEKHKIIKIEDLYFCKAEIEIRKLDNRLIAKEEVSDGEWKIHNPEQLFFQKIQTENRIPAYNTMLIERSIVVVPKLYNKVYLTKNLETPIKALSELVFYSEGLDEVNIIFETEEGQFEIFLEDIQEGQQKIKLSDAKNEFGETYFGNNLINLHFELKSYQLAMPIKLKDLQFHYPIMMTMKQKENEQKHRVYPNPTDGMINIQMEKSGTYKFEIFNSQQPVYLKILDVQGNTQLHLPHLQPGAYYYKISNEENEWVSKLVVK